MARDFIIHGIRQHDFQRELPRNLRKWQLPQHEREEWLQTFQHGFTLTDLKTLEVYLLDHLDLYIDEIQGKLGLVELIAYRSRQNALAVAAAVDFYFQHHLRQQQAVSDADMLEGSILLPKAPMLELIDWLVAFSGSLHELADPIRSKQQAYRQAIDQMRASDSFDADTFATFKELHFPALGWWNTVAASSFDWYYWEDSF